jgi:hypothetical protein
MAGVDCMPCIMKGRSKTFSQWSSAKTMRHKKGINSSQGLSSHTGLSRCNLQSLNLLILGSQFAIRNLPLFPKLLLLGGQLLLPCLVGFTQLTLHLGQPLFQLV